MTPAERILAQFDGVSEETRTIIGESLMLRRATFLTALGSAIEWSSSSPRLATLVLSRALRTAHWEPANLALVDWLGDEDPWRTIKEVLTEALGVVALGGIS